MSNALIDLHTHTIHSDGSDSPNKLLRLAALAGARAVAITDHDNVDGLTEGEAAAEQLGIEFVHGLEVSAEYSPGTMHILGYCIDSSNPNLVETLAELRRARDNRNPQIAERLQAMGFDISYEEVTAIAGSDVVGRPHFARLMVERRYAESIQDAFDRFLAKGAPAYVEKKRLSPAEAIETIHRAGGIAVLAHPYQLQLPSTGEEGELLDHLVGLGLDGVEAIYSRHSEAQRKSYGEMAKNRGLLVTGGSDYHGSYKPDLKLVSGKGDLQVPYVLLEEIRSRAAAHSPA